MWQGGRWGAAAGEGGRRVNRLARTLGRVPQHDDQLHVVRVRVRVRVSVRVRVRVRVRVS